MAGTSFIFNRVNVNGIYCIESRGITETATSVTFNFDASPSVIPRFSGLIAVRIAQTPTSTALPVNFNVPSIAGSSIALTASDGTPATGADVPEAIYLVFYDRTNGVLQIV